MAASNFIACFNETASFEGGYVDNPHDPGGATMAGVTQAVYTAWLAKRGDQNRPVKEISLASRQAIYREEYWNAVRGDELYAGLDLVIVDTGWGSGPKKAIELLQQALGITADGAFGPKTLEALQLHTNSADLINSVCNRRLAFFKGLSTWPYFGKGWTARLDGIQKAALAMNAAALKVTPTRPVQAAVPVNQPPIPAPTPAARVEAVQHTLDGFTPTTPEHLGLVAELEAIAARIVRAIRGG